MSEIPDDIREEAYAYFATQPFVSLESVTAEALNELIIKAFAAGRRAALSAKDAEINALAAEVGRLRSELEKANNEFGSQTAEWPDLWRRVADLKEYQRKAELKVERLREALRYIAKQWPDSFAARHARVSLEQKP